jgi:hypothetical protein
MVRFDCVCLGHEMSPSLPINRGCFGLGVAERHSIYCHYIVHPASPIARDSHSLFNSGLDIEIAASNPLSLSNRLSGT